MSLSKTYGQMQENNDKPYTYDEFQKEVGKRLKQYILLKPKANNIKLCRKLFNKGYTVADTVGMIILNS